MRKLVNLASHGDLNQKKMLEIFRDEDRANLEKDLLVRKAMTFIEENAVEVEPKAE